MIKYPLIGEDSSPDFTSKIFSLIITASATVIFGLCVIFIKFTAKTPDPLYETIQIQLTGDSVIPDVFQPEEAAADSASQEEAGEIAAQTDFDTDPAITDDAEIPELSDTIEELVVEETVPAVEIPENFDFTPVPVIEQPVKTESEPVSKTKPAAVPEKQTPAENKTAEVKNVKADAAVPVKQAEEVKVSAAQEPVKYAMDLSDGFDFNQTNKQKKEFDWSQFDDAPVTPVPSKKVTKVENASSISGTAGKTAASENKEQTSAKTSTSSKADSTSNEASAGTSNSLSNISNAKGTAGAESSGNSALPQSGNSAAANSLNLQWSSGQARGLIMPKELSLVFSKDAQNALSMFSEVKVTFDVDQKGYVLISTLKTTPAVAGIVREEIEKQIEDCWFSSGTSIATANFTLRIKKN